jgi:hypothetical protein
MQAYTDGTAPSWPMAAASIVCSDTSATVRVHVGIAYSDLASAMPTIARIA